VPDKFRTLTKCRTEK